MILIDGRVPYDPQAGPSILAAMSELGGELDLKFCRPTAGFGHARSKRWAREAYSLYDCRVNSFDDSRERQH